MRHIFEVDHVAARLLLGIIVYLLTADVRLDTLGIPRVFCDQCTHRVETLGLALRRSNVVKSETHAKHIRSDERLASIRRKSRWCIVEIAVHEIGRDASYLTPVEDRRADRTLSNVDNAHHHRRLARPFQPPRGPDDTAALPEDRGEAGRARVALADGVGRDQAKRPI